MVHLLSHVNAPAYIEQTPAAAHVVLMYELLGMCASILFNKCTEVRKAALFDERGILGDRHAGIHIHTLTALFLEPNKEIRPLLPEPHDHIVESVDQIGLKILHRSAQLQQEDQLRHRPAAIHVEIPPPCVRLSVCLCLCHDDFLLCTWLRSPNKTAPQIG